MLENYRKQGKTKSMIKCKECYKNNVIALFDTWKNLIEHYSYKHSEIKIDTVILSNYGEIVDIKN